MGKPRILVIEDEKEMLENYCRMLTRIGYECLPLQDSTKAIEEILLTSPDVILTDLRMPEVSGFSILEDVQKRCPEIPVILVTAYGSIPTAVEAVKKGAFDFITKPFSFPQLSIVVERALKQKRLFDENRKLKEQIRQRESQPLIGNSPQIKSLIELIKRVSVTDVNVLITGESGTGKELVAKTIHKKSQRADKPFVIVDCASLPESLLESELFGYEKGAFTGAEKRKIGLFEHAKGGTLFLDEIGEMPIGLQSKLLRAIQDRTVRRIGSNELIELDVRIIAATNRNLEEEVRKGGFREDLFWRINVINIHVPPLRERKEDILILADYFLKYFSAYHKKQLKGFTPQAIAALENYDWPGNVRELQNVIERAVILTNSKLIDLDLLREDIIGKVNGEDIQASSILSYKEVRQQYLSKFERKYLQEILSRTSWNISEAARLSGISRRTLHRMIKKYGITRTSKDGF